MTDIETHFYICLILTNIAIFTTPIVNYIINKKQNHNT